VVLLDIRLPGISGMDILRDIQLNHPLCSTIMITAIGELDTAVEAMKLGAADYIVKPFDLGKVAMSIRNALKEKNSALFLHQMDAISMGVEERIDPFHAYTRIVVERTVDVARQLHIPENVIKKWVESKTLCAAHKTAAKISDHVEPSMHSS